MLLSHPGIGEAFTAVRGVSDSNVLVAYFVPEETPVPVGELRAHARRQLPEHMVPTAFVALQRLPRTPNGKIDEARLPAVDLARDDDVEYVPPRAGIERSLADIWRDILHVEQIGAADNFFEIGGHSLLAAQVRSRILQLLGVELPLDALFEDQTLADLARRIEMDSGVDTAEAPPLRTRCAHSWPAGLVRPGTDVASRMRRSGITGALDRCVHPDHRTAGCFAACPRGSGHGRSTRVAAHHLPVRGNLSIAGNSRLVHTRGADTSPSHGRRKYQRSTRLGSAVA